MFVLWEFQSFFDCHPEMEATLHPSGLTVRGEICAGMSKVMGDRMRGLEVLRVYRVRQVVQFRLNRGNPHSHAILASR